MSADSWVSVIHCPGCDGSAKQSLGNLPGSSYFFGEAILFPNTGIPLAKCLKCGLIYKEVIPTGEFLSAVFARQAGNAWQAPQDFSLERAVILSLLQFPKNFDLLDIGPSNGALLTAFSDLKGRRSGLDLISHPGLQSSLRGEFIEGFLESKLAWSGDPYDVVTVFDVFEHFYSPQIAFVNLNNLVKPQGFVVIETGDTASYWPKKFGFSAWWYIRLFEHHLFWNREALDYYAPKHGFRIISIENVVHKGMRMLSHRDKLKHYVHGVWWKLHRDSCNAVKEFLGKPMGQPIDPWCADHLRIVLQKKG